ncbi:hypothetical protein BH11MYX4_BH11MYX4_00910 [soil metagenome]
MALMVEADSHDSNTDEHPPRAVEGARILVVDDDRAMRDIVSRRLTRNGFSVHEAVSGAELLSVLRSVTADSWPLDGVDLIVLDNRMPGMTGLEAIRNLRADHWETPAILMTAFPDAAVKREAQRLGVPVLPKPFSLDLLSSAVLVVLLSRHAPADDSLSRP